MKQKLSNWGKYPVIKTNIDSFEEVSLLQEILGKQRKTIARGLGRCYGDSSLGEHVISTLRFNRFISFNAEDGTLTCESGVSLAEILEYFVPRGWFLPVTPGTKHVTIGGAIASDVHGKNHHVSGALSNHILAIDLMLDTGEIVSCSPNTNTELFWATCGGMGLTGIILRASFRLIPVETAYVVQETVKAKNIEEIMKLFEESSNWTYTVSWVDCLARGKDLGRSVLIRGEHAKKNDLATKEQIARSLEVKKKKKLAIPFNLPAFVLNNLTVKAFNDLYFKKTPDHIKKTIVDYENFFYPLDSIRNWNRIYGRRGFVQYQFVLPKDGSHEGIKKVLEKVSANKKGSFLAVLKLFGQQKNLISFPTEGYTLALDFQVSPGLFNFLNKLDEIIIDYGGRLYLTKDARMSQGVFQAGYENYEKFTEAKHRFDRSEKFSSFQSKRLGI